MRYKALVGFNAYNITASSGDELIIEDKGIALDLEKLGWVEPMSEKEQTARANVEAKKVVEVKADAKAKAQVKADAKAQAKAQKEQ